MRRAALLGLAALLFLGAALARPAPEAPTGGVWAALGRTLGGVRVMIIDALFLRAEGRRRAGRIEEAAALYQAALALDPANEAAAGFLAGTYVDEFLPQLPDPDERFAWWQEARDLLRRALEGHPDSAELEARQAMLILDAPRSDAALGARIATALGDPQRVALQHLAHALEGGATLPRLGRSHLVRVALLAPFVAGRSLRDGDREALAEARATARRALALHGTVLGEVRLDAGERAPTLRALLQAGLRAVDGVEEARAGRAAPASAEAAIAAYEAMAPAAGLAGPLRAALAERR